MNAFAVLVMGDPQYVIGALTTAHSLRLTETKNQIVCLCTPDIYCKYNDIYHI